MKKFIKILKKLIKKMTKNILVTGGLGFIGSKIIDNLLKKNLM